MLQTAAVIGRQFKLATLEAVHATSEPLDRLLTELQRRELIREKSRLPERVYIFKHALTQETAYKSLLLRPGGRSTCVWPGCWSERRARRRDGSRPSLPGCTPTKRPFPTGRGGDRAASGHAVQEAVRHYEQALEILKSEARDPDDRPSSLRRAG